jgi:hypothetical protein
MADREIIDVDDLADSVLIGQNDEHDETRNAPCNCGDCVAYAMVFGAAKVEMAGAGAWAPVMQAGLVEMVAAAEMRKMLVAAPSMEQFVSNMAVMNVRAFRKDPPNNKVTTKRKSDSQGGNASGKRAANSAMSASAIMPVSN